MAPAGKPKFTTAGADRIMGTTTRLLLGLCVGMYAAVGEGIGLIRDEKGLGISPSLGANRGRHIGMYFCGT